MTPLIRTNPIETEFRGAVQKYCPACGNAVSEAGIIVADHEYGVSHQARYVECPGCGSLFQDPMPTAAQLARFYPADHHSMTHAGLLVKSATEYGRSEFLNSFLAMERFSISDAVMARFSCRRPPLCPAGPCGDSRSPTIRTFACWPADR